MTSVQESGDQSQAVQMEDDSADQFNQTDNKLAQRSSSIVSDDVLFGDQEFEVREPSGRDNLASEDQEVLLELNTEEQEQFEVLDSAGEDEKSQGRLYFIAL